MKYDYKCVDCQSTFSTDVKLLEHQFNCLEVLAQSSSIHHDTTNKVHRGYKNNTNRSSFLKQREKQYDEKSIHKKILGCRTCGKQFTKKSELILHLRSHSSAKPFQCKTCGEAYKYKNSLVIHERKHTGEKPYSCVTCGKSFQCSSNLRIHERTHTDNKPFQCTKCGKRFFQKIALQNHMLTHSTIKAFKCDLCGKQFARYDSLRRHSHGVHSR